ncbi:MAG: hypothetical protein R3F02_01120 [Thiolinea sp.]
MKTLTFKSILLFMVSITTVHSEILPTLPGTDIRNPVDIRCPSDLKAHNITYQILERQSKYHATVRITGTVLKEGAANYVASSSARPTTITIYRDSARWPVRSVTLNVLKTGSYQLSFDEAWNTSSAAEGEFPWTFILSISNENKGCNFNNNSVEWNSGPINDYMRSTE